MLFSISVLYVFMQDGMLKFKGTYEILSPEDIGLARMDASGIVLGKHRYTPCLFFLVKYIQVSFILNLQKICVSSSQWKTCVEVSITSGLHLHTAHFSDNLMLHERSQMRSQSL